MTTHRLGCALLTCALALGLALVTPPARPARALPPAPNMIPVERLAENLKKYTAEHPEQAYAWIRLARVHLFAYVYGTDAVEDKQFLPATAFVGAPKQRPEIRDTESGKQHAQEAFRAFDRAIHCKNTYPLAWAGRAYLLEQAAADLDFLPAGLAIPPLAEADAAAVQAAITALADPDPAKRTAAEAGITQHGLAAAPVLVKSCQVPNLDIRTAVRRLLTRCWQEAAIADYRVAFEQAGPAELKNAKHYSDVWNLVCYVAAISYKRMVTARGATEAETSLIQKMEKQVEDIKAAFGPPPPISPIVFSLQAAQPLRAIVDPQCTVTFDLDGDGVAERRSWLQADTAILCWDPAGEGQITSGRQLFGNVTWWLPWKDGYEALDALDDNRDGELSGAELTGLAVWIDANQNGVSDPGEVQPAAAAGIAALSCRAPDTAPAAGYACPANHAGLRRSDGQILPTYDWFAPAPAPAPAPASALAPVR